MANTIKDSNYWKIISGPSKFNLVIPPFIEGHDSPVRFHCKHEVQPYSRLDVVVSGLVVQTCGTDPVEGTTSSYLFWGQLSMLHRLNYDSPFVIGSYSPTERTGWLRLIGPMAYLAVLATLGSENARNELEQAGYKLPGISSPLEPGQPSGDQSKRDMPRYRILRPIRLSYVKDGQPCSHTLDQKHGVILFCEDSVLKGTNGETRRSYTTPVTALAGWLQDGSITLI